MEQLSRPDGRVHPLPHARPQAEPGACPHAHARSHASLEAPCHARFALEVSAIRGDEVTFPPDTARQLARVLRLRPGQVLTVVVEGREIAVRLEHLAPARATGRVLGPVERFGEPHVRVAVVQALLKGDRTDLVVQKATELGAGYILPAVTARTVVRPEAGTGRLRRWQRIAREAAEQSLRTRVPVVHPPQELGVALRQARNLLPQADLIVLWEAEEQVGLLDLLPQVSTDIILVMGPEGGLTRPEVDTVLALGGRPASLGTRIVRSETATLAALTLVLAARGELGRAPGPPAERGSPP